MAYKYINKLHGQRVLVIGGTKGIGYGIAEAAIEHGATVIIASRKQENIDTAIAQLKESYPDKTQNISGAPVDLTADDIESELERFLNLITEQGAHKINHLIETVGDGLPDVNLDALTASKLESESRLRITGPVILAKVARKYMVPGHTSSFTMTTGILVDKPMPGFGILSAIGAYKEGLARGMAVDLAPLRVNVVSPGVIRTGMLEGAGEEMVKRAEAGTVLGRVGSVEDVTEVYLGVVRSGFVTGSVVAVNGGHYLK